jgi:hypothetical protein
MKASIAAKLAQRYQPVVCGAHAGLLPRGLSGNFVAGHVRRLIFAPSWPA